MAGHFDKTPPMPALPAPLKCACLVDRRDDTLLLVRVRDNPHWYLPGGKIEPGETPAAALQRELLEELGIRLETDSIRYLYTVLGPAYGQPGEVELVCFAGNWAGEARACAEISEIAWLSLAETDKFAPAVRQLCAEQLQAG